MEERKEKEKKGRVKKEDKELINNRCYNVSYSIVLCNIVLCDIVLCSNM